MYMYRTFAVLCPLDNSVQIIIPNVIITTEKYLEIVYFFFSIQIPIIMLAIKEP